MTSPSPEEHGRLLDLARGLRTELDLLRAEAAARAVTERATGMLMERLGCSPEAARAQLGRLAAEAGTSVAGVAADITGERLPPLPAAARSGASRADAAIPAASDADRLAEALLTEALAAERATAVAVWLLTADGGMELAGQSGFGPLEAARWRRIPPAVPSPSLRAVRADTETWWPAGQPSRDPSFLIGQPDVARAVVPLRVAGTCTGALEVCWPGTLADFPQSVRALLPALAGPCAQALSAGLPPGTLTLGPAAPALFGLLGGLQESVLYARAAGTGPAGLAGLTVAWASPDFRDPAGRTAADVTGRRVLELYPEAARPGGLLDAAGQVRSSGQACHLRGIPLATGGHVDVRLAPLLDGVVLSWVDAGEAERLAALLDAAQRLGHAGGWEENLLTGQVQWTPPACAIFGRPPGNPVPLAGLHEHVPADDIPAVAAFRDRLAWQREPVTAAFRIIRGDDASVRQVRVLAQPVAGPAGTVIAVRGAYHDVSDRYHTEAAFTATREQLAGTQERAREEHQLALRLQQAITPQVARPVEAAGIDVAARYQAAGQLHLVGGDWYDAVLLPDKNVLLVVGDVAGHGIDAVTGMVALRNHLRGLAITGAGPGTLLRWVNAASYHLADGIATTLCGIYDPVTRVMRWARAGHLPPLLVRDGLARPLGMPGGMLLGADPSATYEEAETTLELGDVLVLYTDGLVERRDQPLDASLAELGRQACRPVASIEEFADYLISHAPSDTGDDTCLVAIRVRLFPRITGESDFTGVALYRLPRMCGRGFPANAFRGKRATAPTESPGNARAAPS